MIYTDNTGLTIIDSDQILPEPEHTIQVIRSFDVFERLGVNFERKTITLHINDDVDVKFNTINEMYLFVAYLDEEIGY